MDSDSDWSDNVEGGREERGTDGQKGNHHLVSNPGVKVVSDPELVGATDSGRNWKGILIAIVVIAIVCGLIVIAVVLVTPGKEDGNQGKPFTFDDIFSSEFVVQSFEAKWIPNTEKFVYQTIEETLVEYDVTTNSTSSVFDVTDDPRMRNSGFYHFLSADLNYILLAHDIEAIYRHTFRAKYVVYNRTATDHSNRFIPFPQSGRDEWSQRKLQYADWAPAGHALTFVYENNLYFQPDLMTTPTQVTDSGVINKVFNGIPDWLYEEEILHTNVAHWWSPGARHIAYAQFNDSLVPLFKFPFYGEGDNLYGTISELAYPKAGDNRDDVNPTVKIFVVETERVKTSHRQIPPPAQFADKDHYVTLVSWQDDTHLLIAWSNRAQNKTIVTLCHVLTTSCRQVLVETNRGGRGWVLIEHVKFINQGQQFLTILPNDEGDSGAWKHVAMVTTSMNTDGIKTFLTHGRYDVSEILAYDQEKSFVYYLSTNGDPKQRHLFRVYLRKPDEKSSPPECLTCDVPDCRYVSARFSTSSRYYVRACLGPEVPYYSLHDSLTGTLISILEENADMKSRLEEKSLPRKEYFQFKTEDGQDIWGQIYIPAAVRADQSSVYPLLVHTYGGPGTQLVTEEFRLGWSTYLGSSEKVIYASFDGRGSGGHGDRFLFESYHRLGTVEIKDQILGANYLTKKFPFIDKDRVAIWGWSYGGFVVSHVLGDDEDALYKCGIAVAPVTDWKYYDTAYTERYLGFASSAENSEGYNEANVSNKAKNFSGKGFLLVHGTADDNVHFQHTAQLIKALTEADVTFRLQVYADRNHGLSGGRTNLHLYRTMTGFLQKDCWDGGGPKDTAKAPEPTQKQKG